MKQEFHLKIAKNMETSYQDSRNFSPSDIAYHYVKSGNKEKSIEFSLIAGHNALEKIQQRRSNQTFHICD